MQDQEGTERNRGDMITGRLDASIGGSNLAVKLHTARGFPD